MVSADKAEQISSPEIHEYEVVRPTTQKWWMWVTLALLLGAALFLSLYHLTDYPTTWFDEGSHLHVPKTLVKYGVYADYSSEGFRYYGPTIGVGPTVMLPLAAAFQLFGIGLLQARLVMALYLIAAIVASYFLGRQLGSWQMAVVATTLLIVTPATALLQYGRQVLGEVPGIFFLFVALTLWLAGWDRACWRRLSLVGIFLGLAIITKSQYLLIIVPSIGLMWLLNLVYYRLTPQRTFIIPGLIAGICAVLWQAYLILYLGPATAMENFAILREASAGAAFVFSTELMSNSVRELLSVKVYLGALIPTLIYGFWISLPRQRENQRWSILYILMVVNLLWYVTASIGWIRYAFLGLTLMSFFVAKFFADLTDNFSFATITRLFAGRNRQPIDFVRATAWVWLAAMIALPAIATLRPIMAPSHNAPVAMAEYLDANIPEDALIETWEPEMGFLTDHNYHFPPPELLDKAVGYIWRGGTSPTDSYNFVQTESPDYVLVGGFSEWVNLYPEDLLAKQYELITTIDAYKLYKLRSQ